MLSSSRDLLRVVSVGVLCCLLLLPACSESLSASPPRKRIPLGTDTETIVLKEYLPATGQRWQDIAGNHYTAAYRTSFRYADAKVEVTYRRRGPTFVARFNARGLKPHFAYQVKLVGDPADAWAFETIGYLGRWLIGTRGTNFSDAKYRRAKRRTKRNADTKIKAYILVDFFVTDAKGNAAGHLQLDSSWHVIWSRKLNRRKRHDRYKDSPIQTYSFTPLGTAYWRPRQQRTTQHLWLEQEWVSKRPAKGRAQLPSGRYSAKIQLTEESFHMKAVWGRWAEVLEAPVTFEIQAPAASQDRSRR